MAIAKVRVLGLIKIQVNVCTLRTEINTVAYQIQSFWILNCSYQTVSSINIYFIRCDVKFDVSHWETLVNLFNSRVSRDFNWINWGGGCHKEVVCDALS